MSPGKRVLIRNPNVRVTTKAPTTRVSVPDQVSHETAVTGGIVGPPGPRGLPGSGGSGSAAFEYLMPVAQTTAVFDHTLGRDPVAVQVIVDGQVCDEYSVTFPLPSERIQVGFDVSVKALIRIS